MSARRVILLLAAIVAVGLVVVLIATCGDDDSEPGASDEPAAEQSADAEPAEDDGEASDDSSPFARDACELLTDDDTEAILGERTEGTFTPGEAESFTPGRCEWATGRPVQPNELRASGVAVFLGDEKIYDNTRIIAENGDDFEELDGIGDEAYAGGGEGGLRIGDAGITVTVIGVNTNSPDTHRLLVDILERIAANY